MMRSSHVQNGTCMPVCTTTLPYITNHKELFSTLIPVPDSGRPVSEMTGQGEKWQGEAHRSVHTGFDHTQHPESGLQMCRAAGNETSTKLRTSEM